MKGVKGWGWVIGLGLLVALLAPSCAGPNAVEPQSGGRTTFSSFSVDVAKLEEGTLEQAADATGLRISAPAWLPEGTRRGSVMYRADPPLICQAFGLVDGHYLLLSAFPPAEPAPDSERIQSNGLEAFFRYVAPEPGDTVSEGLTTLDWEVSGVGCRLEVDGPADLNALLAIAASVQVR